MAYFNADVCGVHKSSLVIYGQHGMVLPAVSHKYSTFGHELLSLDVKLYADRLTGGNFHINQSV
jgi:hypothetical protein